MPEGLLIEFTVDCPKCGEPASNGNTLFTDYAPDKPLRVDLEMTAAQETFTCTDPGCGTQCYTGDLDVLGNDDVDGDDDD